MLLTSGIMHHTSQAAGMPGPDLTRTTASSGVSTSTRQKSVGLREKSATPWLTTRRDPS